MSQDFLALQWPPGTHRSTHRVLPSTLHRPDLTPPPRTMRLLPETSACQRPSQPLHLHASPATTWTNPGNARVGKYANQESQARGKQFFSDWSTIPTFGIGFRRGANERRTRTRRWSRRRPRGFYVSPDKVCKEVPQESEDGAPCGAPRTACERQEYYCCG